jgi:hypothetical protein
VEFSGWFSGRHTRRSPSPSSSLGKLARHFKPRLRQRPWRSGGPSC